MLSKCLIIVKQMVYWIFADWTVDFSVVKKKIMQQVCLLLICWRVQLLLFCHHCYMLVVADHSSPVQKQVISIHRWVFCKKEHHCHCSCLFVDLPKRCRPSPHAGGARSQEPAHQGFFIGATKTWADSYYNQYYFLSIKPGIFIIGNTIFPSNQIFLQSAILSFHQIRYFYHR